MLVYDSNLKIFYSTKINDRSYFSGFGTRFLGDARKVENIINFFKQREIFYQTLAVAEQIHSVNIAIFKEEDSLPLKKIEDVDGIITQQPNTILTVRTADCLPAIYVDKKRKIIGVSHQGWRGSIKRMPQKMIEKMIELGAKKEDILVALGPSIGSCCYEIDDDRYYLFLEEFDGYSDKIFSFYHGRRYLNLLLLNFLLLKEVGIRQENIDYRLFCTKCDKNFFFSFRRDREKDYGEMLSFILRNEDD